jgi:hypothetical protein
MTAYQRKFYKREQAENAAASTAAAAHTEPVDAHRFQAASAAKESSHVVAPSYENEPADKDAAASKDQPSESEASATRNSALAATPTAVETATAATEAIRNAKHDDAVTEAEPYSLDKSGGLKHRAEDDSQGIVGAGGANQLMRFKQGASVRSKKGGTAFSNAEGSDPTETKAATTEATEGDASAVLRATNAIAATEAPSAANSAQQLFQRGYAAGVQQEKQQEAANGGGLRFQKVGEKSLAQQKGGAALWGKGKAGGKQKFVGGMLAGAGKSNGGDEAYGGERGRGERDRMATRQKEMS